jgi:DoxX-like family
MCGKAAVMNVALWVVQGALAAVFAVSGAAKAVLSKERMLATGQTGVRDYSLPAIRMIAACELAAVLGLILPGLLGRGLALTPLAAVGLAIVMIGAAVAHTRLHEPRNVAVNAILFAMCLFVAAVRFTELLRPV